MSNLKEDVFFTDEVKEALDIRSRARKAATLLELLVEQFQLEDKAKTMSWQLFVDEYKALMDASEQTNQLFQKVNDQQKEQKNAAPKGGIKKETPKAAT